MREVRARRVRARVINVMWLAVAEQCGALTLLEAMFVGDAGGREGPLAGLGAWAHGDEARGCG